MISEQEYLKLIGRNISRHRKLQNLTIKDLGFKCDIEYSNLIPLEKGRINITFSTLYKIADALSIDVSELLKAD